MIGIIANGTRLVLNPNTSIRFTLVNPLYSGEVGYGSQSFSFSIPDNDVNRVALGLKDITFIEDFDDLVDVTLEVGGMPWAPAKLEVSQVPGYGDWKAMLFLDESRLALALKDKMLNEFELGGVRVISTETVAYDVADDLIDHANAAAAGSIDTFDYTFFPIRNTYPFYGGYNEDEAVAAQTLYFNWWMNDSFWSRLGTATKGGSPIDAVCNLVPQPYLLRIIEMMLEEEGYGIIPSTFTLDSEIKTLSIYNTYAIDKLTLFGAPFVSVYGYYNWFQPTINLQNHVPADLSGLEFLSGIMKAFGLVFKIGINEVTILTRNEILNDKNEQDWRGLEETYQWEKKTFQGHHLQDIPDDSDELMGGDYLRDPEDFVVAGEVDYVDDLPINPTIQAADIYYVINENSYYELVVTDPVTETREWVRYSGRFDEITVGTQDSRVEITSPVSTTMIYDGPSHGGNVWRTPWVQQLGSSPEYGLGVNPYSLRLLFYRGLLTNGGASETYPMASPDDVMDTYNYSLYLHGEKGRYNIWWKNWVQFRQAARPVTYTLRLPFSEFFRLDPFKRVRVRTKDAEVSGYWRQLDFTITMDGITQVQMEMEAGIVSGELEVLPVNTSLPAITGTPEVGQTLGITPGTWTEPGTIAYQWYLDGVAISGATANTYTVVTGDIGGTITVVETITNGAGSASATSAGVGPVTAVVFDPTSISGLEAWYDVSDAAARTLSGSNIIGLADKAGNGHDISFTAGHSTLATAQFNGLDAAYFPGLGVGQVAMALTDITMFIVWDSEDIGKPYPGPVAFTNSSYTGYSGYGIGFFSNFLRMYDLAAGLVTSFWGESEAMPLSLHGFQVNGSTNAVVAFKNGTSDTGYTASGSAVTDGFVMGGLYNNANRFHGGHICEILIYDAVLSPTDIADIQTYLMDKWDI